MYSWDKYKKNTDFKAVHDIKTLVFGYKTRLLLKTKQNIKKNIL